MSHLDTAERRTRSPERLLTQASTRHRQAPSARRILLRRIMVVAAKLGLPLLALALLGTVALWPEIARMTEQGRLAIRRVFSVEPDTGRMLQPRYRGGDQKGRPYTLTGDWAVQSGPNRIELGMPKGDLVLESGAWMMVEAQQGIYIQHAGQLDLAHDVVLYRDDGTVIRTETAAVDVKQGAAASDDKTHAEGPFGVLDAQGFMLTEKGSAIQFQGPARLVLNGGIAK